VSSVPTNALIQQWREKFRRAPLAASVVTDLRSRSDDIWRHAFDLLKRESPEYRNSVDDAFTRESKAHCNELLRMIVAIASTRMKQSNADPFDFVRTHAAWRARHQVPLTASLHAYRIAHRTYSEITRDAVLLHGQAESVISSLTLLSDFWMEFFDFIGTVLAEAHAVEEGLIVAQDTPSYVDLIADLLRGAEPRNAEAQRLCAICGIRPGSPLAVAVARPHQSENGRFLDREATLRSFVRLFEQLLPRAVFGRLIDIRNDEVTVIVCSETATARRFLQALCKDAFATRAGNGCAVRLGVSADTVSIASLPHAVNEARIAVDFANSARPLMHFSDVDLQEFVVRRSDSAATRLVPTWMRQTYLGDDVQWRELMRTIRAFADCSLNVKQAARNLGVHTNTVYFRLNRIGKLSGVNPRTYTGLSMLLTALRLLEVHGAGERSP